LHPSAAGRTYAAYGGMYIAVALVWLWRVDGIAPTRWDLIGAAVALANATMSAKRARCWCAIAAGPCFIALRASRSSVICRRQSICPFPLGAGISNCDRRGRSSAAESHAQSG